MSKRKLLTDKGKEDLGLCPYSAIHQLWDFKIPFLYL